MSRRVSAARGLGTVPPDRQRGRAARSPVAAGPDPAPPGSGRVRHDEKITVYVSGDELLALEQARLTLRARHGMAVDRGRIVREAIAAALADFESGATTRSWSGGCRSRDRSLDGGSAAVLRRAQDTTALDPAPDLRPSTSTSTTSRVRSTCCCSSSRGTSSTSPRWRSPRSPTSSSPTSRPPAAPGTWIRPASSSWSPRRCWISRRRG